MDIERDSLETKWSSRFTRHGVRLKSKSLQIDDTMAWDDDSYRNAQFLECERKCAQDIAQAANLGKRETLAGHHTYVQIRPSFFESWKFRNWTNPAFQIRNPKSQIGRG